MPTRSSRGVTSGAVDRDRLVRRNTWLLALAQGLIGIAFPVMLVVGTVAAAELTGRDGATGLIWGSYFAAAAGGAFAIGRAMDRFGRRPGLVASYAVVGIAGAACMVSVAAGSYVGLLASAVPFGVAFGGSQLIRGAVADMYPPATRGRAVGYLLAAGTVGAVGSPLLVAVIRSVAEGRGADPNVAPWLLVPAAAAGAIVAVLAVRPDPRDLAPELPTGEPAVPVDAPPRGPRELLALPAFRTAVLAAAIGQMAMVGIMGVTPNALHHLGHAHAVTSWVIAIHITGMFAFSPLFGSLMDRYGRRPGLLGGGAASVVGAVVASTGASALMVGIGLFLIGIGWSATFLGATAVISDATSPLERGGALGFTDLLVSFSSGVAGLAGGIVLELAGFRSLTLGMAVLVMGVMVLVAVGLRTPPSAVPVGTGPNRPAGVGEPLD
jgi:MFS family permease